MADFRPKEQNYELVRFAQTQLSQSTLWESPRAEILVLSVAHFAVW